MMEWVGREDISSGISSIILWFANYYHAVLNFTSKVTASHAFVSPSKKCACALPDTDLSII